MKKTVFIRLDKLPRDEACDVASAPLTNKAVQKVIAYLGSAWGSHEATDAVDQAVIDGDPELWANSRGFFTAEPTVNSAPTQTKRLRR